MMNFANKDVWTTVFDPQQPISGGMARVIRELRDGTHERSTLFDDQETMIAALTGTVAVHKNRHSFCTNDNDGCIGRVRLEMIRCAGCSDAVITRDCHGNHWINKYAQLIDIKNVTDIPLLTDKFETDLAATERVLQDLELLDTAKHLINTAKRSETE